MKERPMFGTYIFPWGPNKPSVQELKELAATAAGLGFDVHLPTHFLLPQKYRRKFGNSYLLEPLTLAAAISSDILGKKIGFSVIVAPLLHPYAWTKFLTTLDIITDGRIIVGLGIGWAQELEIFGVDYRRRGAIIEEQLEIMKKLWTQDEVSYQGKFYKFENVYLEPKPVQKPHPPIWIGGGRSPPFRPTIGRAAKYGDAWLPQYIRVKEANEYFPILREESRKNGRDVRMAIWKRVSISNDTEKVRKKYLLDGLINLEKECIIGTSEECAERIRQYSEAGATYFIMDFQMSGGASSEYAAKQMETFVDSVVPQL